MVGIEKNDERLVQDRAEAGDAQAQYAVGCALLDRPESDESRRDAYQWFQRAASHGHAAALGQLARCCMNGWGGPVNEIEGVRLGHLAAEAGDALGERVLGNACEYGRGGIPQSLYDAVNWYTKAADRGDPAAQTKIGELYADGKGVPQSDDESVRWYRKAADQGFARAAMLLGARYENGRGVEQSWPEAAAWYHKAAEKGNVEAQEKLGWCYASGKGVSPSWVEAAVWWRKAAERGAEVSQYNLGLISERGDGVPQSWDDAIHWYRLSAEQGYASAQASLGRCYQSGAGVAPSYANAIRWLTMAAEQGNENAQHYLRLGFGIKAQFGDTLVDLIVTPIKFEGARMSVSASTDTRQETTTEFKSVGGGVATTSGQFVATGSGGAVYVPGQTILLPTETIAIPTTQTRTTTTTSCTLEFTAVIGNVRTHYGWRVNAHEREELEGHLSALDALGSSATYLVALGGSGFAASAILGVAKKTEGGRVELLDVSAWSGAASLLSLSAEDASLLEEARAREKTIKVRLGKAVDEMHAHDLSYGRNKRVLVTEGVRGVGISVPPRDKTEPTETNPEKRALVTTLWILIMLSMSFWFLGRGAVSIIGFFGVVAFAVLTMYLGRKFRPRKEYFEVLPRIGPVVSEFVERVRRIVDEDFAGSSTYWVGVRGEAEQAILKMERHCNEIVGLIGKSDRTDARVSEIRAQLQGISWTMLHFPPRDYEISRMIHRIEREGFMDRIKQALSKQPL
ncbi:TPA: sel1 repeat family protein [Burkholderia aenigmatica]|uniref:tetratricopeptide repeat protein n=1 Tax=Burkholderia sp. AU45251 TaxID=3059204 RepID=UPI002656E456|nr:tetratricopeptide repeat protein [Burkholderia sp. AU45251]HDR9483237.1 sel1 repeat family protein [Burkholderia aenigmatica]MDN7516102.1 tetratricopeptide repeat protein [Burkholderia sp. AU45251]HDR9514185.1 sel1 repeat family protein [Burkholderia aenigmatica]HDR9591575.1 sel1 repeat family protein [Burkholderia aenigmatica]HDR9598667.1 sel1 repeat family protein [Burkholderia aenigmatica]